jgi:hypothetical protein
MGSAMGAAPEFPKAFNGRPSIDFNGHPSIESDGARLSHKSLMLLVADH